MNSLPENLTPRPHSRLHAMERGSKTETQTAPNIWLSSWTIWTTALVLLAAFFIATVDLTRDSLWNDEGWTAWAVQSPYLADMLARVRADVHPPLYFLLLDGWTRVAGDSVYVLRLLSVLLGMVGLAATYAVGRQWVDRATGLIGLVILGTASFFVYYTREARMYTLLLALGALATGAYGSWRARPTGRRTLGYGLLLAALLYTHYAGALVIVTHLLHGGLIFLLRVRSVAAGGSKPSSYDKKMVSPLEGGWSVPDTNREQGTGYLSALKLLIPYAIALIFYFPWLPIFLSQMRANPNGPLAIPVATDWSAVAALVLILVGGSWWLYVVPFALGSAIPKLRQYGSGVLLLALWLLVTPLALLALNAWVAPVYQVRYAIALLPAGALLAAYGLRWVGIPDGLARFYVGVGTRYIVSLLLIAILLLLMVVNQLTIYPELWPEKPPWDATIRAMTGARSPLDPTITDIAAYSPVAYYDRLLHIRQGVALDLSWRLHHYDEIMTLAGKFAAAPSVWVALPVNTAKTWHIIAALDAGRAATYRSSLVNMLFYRFDKGDEGDLAFRFGDRLRFVSGPRADTRFSVAAGKTLCVELGLTALAGLDGAYSAGLHLVDITGTTVVAQWDAGLGSPVVDATLALEPCMDIRPNVSPGYYHLELVVYQWANQERLRLFEDGGGDPLPWGDVLMLAAVDVTG